jgi:hypothetical protein
MFINSRLNLFLFVTLLCVPQATARQYHAPSLPAEGKIRLDVVVTPKSGPPVSGLQQQDFTILDNEAPQTISSFKAVNGRLAPVEVVLVIDAVNAGSENVDLLREGINEFLKADEGRLAYPTMLAILTNTEIQFQEDFSQDGNAISTALDQRAIALRSIGRSADSYGAAARFQISLHGLRRLVAREGGKPGRKLISTAVQSKSKFRYLGRSRLDPVNAIRVLDVLHSGATCDSCEAQRSRPAWSDTSRASRIAYGRKILGEHSFRNPGTAEESGICSRVHRYLGAGLRRKHSDFHRDQCSADSASFGSRESRGAGHF